MADRKVLVAAVVVCDGCRAASLTVLPPVNEEALAEFGWADGLCPMCRPDSPLEAVKGVLMLADQLDETDYKISTRVVAGWIRDAVRGCDDCD